MKTLRRRLFLSLSMLLIFGVAAAATAQDPTEWLTAPPSDREEIVSCIMKFFGSGPGPEHIVDPEVEVVAEVDEGDHVRRTLRYWVEEGERGEAYLLLPK